MWDWLNGKGSQSQAPANAARIIGNIGEKRAERFLCRTRRFRVIARNWHSPRDRRDEIDLICLDGEVLVFVEVKTRSSDAAVSGYHAVDRRKKQALFRAADAYLKALPQRNRPATFRLDVVEVASVPATDDADIRHFENVPLFPKYYW
jgi:putative endonuclease